MARFAKANNDKAHSEVLKSELQIVSQALSDVTIKVSSLKEEISHLKSEGALIRDENEQVKQDTQGRLKEVYEKEQALKDKEQAFVALCNDKEAKSKGLEKESRDKVLKLRLEIARKETEIALLSLKADAHQNIITLQEQDIKTNELTLEQIRGKIQGANEGFRVSELSHTRELNNLEKQIKDKSKELETVTAAIDAEKVKISKPMELLRKAHEDITRRQSDLDIFKSQLDNHWEDILRRRKL